MKEKDFNAWSKSRKKGKLKYILINGVMAWGLPMFIVMTFFVNTAFDESGLLMSHVKTDAITWIIMGLFVGIFTWFYNESEYQKEMVKRTKT